MELTDARTKLYLIGVAYFIQLVNGDTRISRADISAVLGTNEDPNFWPSRGRRNSPETKIKQYLARKYNTNTVNGHLEKPLYVDEPAWLTMDRRSEEDDDYFWVTRGRRGNSWKHPTAVSSNSNYRSRDESDNNIK
ncbi:Hypothetical protein CINCED_3A012300 [Cinara cedri]|uniref:Uncharacterized protein n=1 Tax=Cinara cedri TaxID=506608 RepID=A0A5E4NB67_9HEMI|nr:Hypothetical protein CINCED_3A012300 [Cinara cedri]